MLEIIKKLAPQKFNDFLALLIMVVIFPLIWVLQGRGIINIPEGVIGATIAIETLIAQFCFRKARDESNDST